MSVPSAPSDDHPADADVDGVHPAGDVRFGYVDHRWIFTGGDEDEASVTLHFVIQGDGDDGSVRYRSVRLPVSVEDDDLVVGEIEIVRTPLEQDSLL